VRSAERRSTVDANPTVRLARRISWMSLSSVATCADTARSTAAITSPPTRPPRTPNASAQASAAGGVQIEPITGASAAIWAGVCSRGVVASTPTVTTRSATAAACRAGFTR
jgi:hypothetical protein